MDKLAPASIAQVAAHDSDPSEDESSDDTENSHETVMLSSEDLNKSAPDTWAIDTGASSSIGGALTHIFSGQHNCLMRIVSISTASSADGLESWAAEWLYFPRRNIS
ncbi:hypothetical protein E4U31_005327 [Claviceps sp. LM219 group G6]|nr:hypothetical protein E4U31_005327 [Claviceps sp. LM219 group G6]